MLLYLMTVSQLVELYGGGGEQTRCVLQNVRYIKGDLLRSFPTVLFAPLPLARLSDLSFVTHFTLFLIYKLVCGCLENGTNDSDVFCTKASLVTRCVFKEWL
jgi:hypothetical protein